MDKWEEEGQFPAHKVFKTLGQAGFLGVDKPTGRRVYNCRVLILTVTDSLRYLKSLLPQIKAWFRIQCKVYLYSLVTGVVVTNCANTENYAAECLS